MLKILLKKQFQAFAYALRPKNKKTGKKAGKGGGIAIMILLGFCAISLAFGFVGMSYLFLDGFPEQIRWLYFAIMGICSVFLGTLGTVFNTYAGLFRAKDNELLLSMPIKSYSILLSRMVFDFILCILYVAVCWIPSVVMYQIICGLNIPALIFGIILLFIIPLLCQTLACLLGWVVALISSKIHSKVPAVVLGSLCIFALYYFIYVKMNEFLQTIVNNSEQIAKGLKGANPIYLIGQAGVGDTFSMLIISAGIIALFAATMIILSATFSKITTTQKGTKGKEYKAKRVEKSSLGATLLKREFKHFLSSPAYMLNCGLGIVLMPILIIVLFLKMADIRQLVALLDLFQDATLSHLIPVAVCAIIGMVSTMNSITAPSISLEGNSLWILQSMPTNTKKVLASKQYLHIILTAPLVLAASICISIVLQIQIAYAILISIVTFLFVLLNSGLGIMINLKKPNLTWTTETEPIKQNVGVLILIFGGWAVNIAYAVGYYFLRSFIHPVAYLSVLIVIMLACLIFINRWINTKGVTTFEKLN